MNRVKSARTMTVDINNISILTDLVGKISHCPRSKELAVTPTNQLSINKIALC